MYDDAIGNDWHNETGGNNAEIYIDIFFSPLVQFGFFAFGESHTPF